MEKNILRFALVFVIFGVCQSDIYEKLYTCSMKDSECQKKLYHDIYYDFAETGIPELNIPPYDPLHIQNINIEVLNMVNITLVDGIVKGVKDCKFEEFVTDFENHRAKHTMLCDVVIKGKFTVSASSPIIETILGGSELHGEGKTKVKIEKLRIEFSYPLTTKRHDDGEIYVTCQHDEIEKKFDLLGKVTFAANNIFLGKQDVSELVVNILNNNSKEVMESFGKFFYAKAGSIVFDMIRRFFHYVPAKYYISEDLTPYLTE